MNVDGTYNIKFEDGSLSRSVAADDIRAAATSFSEFFITLPAFMMSPGTTRTMTDICDNLMIKWQFDKMMFFEPMPSFSVPTYVIL